MGPRISLCSIWRPGLWDELITQAGGNKFVFGLLPLLRVIHILSSCPVHLQVHHLPLHPVLRLHLFRSLVIARHHLQLSSDFLITLLPIETTAQPILQLLGRLGFAGPSLLVNCEYCRIVACFVSRQFCNQIYKAEDISILHFYC